MVSSETTNSVNESFFGIVVAVVAFVCRVVVSLFVLLDRFVASLVVDILRFTVFPSDTLVVVAFFRFRNVGGMFLSVSSLSEPREDVDVRDKSSNDDDDDDAATVVDAV